MGVYRSVGRPAPAGKIIVVLILMLRLFCDEASAQKRWDGEGNDGLWQNPVNWVGNQLPLPADDVVFDNTMAAGDYVVSVGSGAASAIVRSLSINPASGRIIRLMIPVDNTAVPAITCAANPYGLMISNGGILVNASGAAVGSTMVIADSIRIQNGGKYQHATARGHADLVRILSRVPGTETGEFEFSVPVASSTVSVSGQVFGKLKLSPGNNGVVNYTGTGVNGLTIRSDLEIAPGVNLSFNLEGRMEVAGDFRHEGGIVNLGSTARKLQLLIGGNFTVANASVITETGTAIPEIIMTGTRPAQVDLRGTITNEIIWGVNKPTGLGLSNNLHLPYELRLASGQINTNGYLVSLGNNCRISPPVDPSASFINGGLRKQGLVNEDFMFPVGKDGHVRWVGLKNATGNFLVTYNRADPGLLSPKLAGGIHHISGLEYWSITSDDPNSAAGPELSFDNVNSGGVTELGQLRVARLLGDTWQNLGNLATTGTAGSSGSVTGSAVTGWLVSQPVIFTLASTQATQNPLPIVWKYIEARKQDGAILLRWASVLEGAVYYEVQTSISGLGFMTLARIPVNPLLTDYSFIDRRIEKTASFYRVILVKSDSSKSYSKIVGVGGNPFPEKELLRGTADRNNLRLYFSEPIVPGTSVRVFDVAGHELCHSDLRAYAGSTSVQLSCPIVRTQVIVVQVIFAGARTSTIKILVP